MAINQLNLFQTAALQYEGFSHDHICDDTERMQLEEHYSFISKEDTRFSRKIVSFQANKGEIVHGWIKYREGFSAQLVEILIDDFGFQKSNKILDPFAGSATTLLVAKAKGIDADGIEILPNCHLSWNAKSRFDNYNIGELKKIMEMAKIIEIMPTHKPFPHVTITFSAFSPNTERELMFFSEWCENLEISHDAKILCKLILTSILEEVSYTRKDGQYLRWDSRSLKLRGRNNARTDQGRIAINGIDKGELPSVRQSFIKALAEIIRDIEVLQKEKIPGESKQNLIEGSTLFVLPKTSDAIYDGVITSPPYLNRYDYTRTYALELAFLGVGEKINKLRQILLSCTVENKSKSSQLREYYESLGLSARYETIQETLNDNKALQEINVAMKTRWERGDLNNKGVLRMIDQYFIELGFVFAELYRVCRSNAMVAFVNDNTRYGGEIIPVDTITTNLAETFGFEPISIFVLPQRKGNSSQQMGKFGRAELRKCITIWRKP